MSPSIGPRSVFAALLLLVGLGLAGYGAYDYTRQADVIERAVEVNATVTGTSVETVTSKHDQSYEPTVSFTYRFDGGEYTSDRLFPTDVDPKYDTRSKARSVVREYDRGETVTAYVNPETPDEAFLEKKRSTYSLKLAGIGSLILLLTVGSAVRSSLDG